MQIGLLRRLSKSIREMSHLGASERTLKDSIRACIQFHWQSIEIRSKASKLDCSRDTCLVVC